MGGVGAFIGDERNRTSESDRTLWPRLQGGGFAMSVRITIRLSDEEAKKLSDILTSEKLGDHCKSEMVRLLIHREYNRRKGIAKPKPQEYQTDHRKGRPGWRQRHSENQI